MIITTATSLTTMTAMMTAMSTTTASTASTTTAAAVRCQARDVSRLEPLVWFFFPFFLYLKFILGPLNTLKH